MYILNANMEAPYIGAVKFDLLTNAIVIPVLKVLHRELVNPFGILNMK